MSDLNRIAYGIAGIIFAGLAVYYIVTQVIELGGGGDDPYERLAEAFRTGLDEDLANCYWEYLEPAIRAEFTEDEMRELVDDEPLVWRIEKHPTTPLF